MSNKIKSAFFVFLSVTLVSILLSGCKKDDPATTDGLIFNSKLTYGTVTDVNGNVYKTIPVGTQTWMAENLRVLHYTNGDTISKIADNLPWSKMEAGAYCDYGGNAAKAATYGKLYNFYALHDTRKLCPTGWHVPTDAEWETMVNFLGGYELVTSDKLRETGTTHWAYLNEGANNDSGFTALPGGMRDFGGLYTDFGQMGFFWTSTPAGDYYNLDAVYFYLSNSVSYGVGSKKNGMSVRCVKD